MLRCIGLFVVCIAAAAQAGELAPDAVKDKATAVCTRAILTRLKDPESAKIKGPLLGFIRGLMTPGEWGASFVVNARNSFGGYTGDQGWWCQVDATGRTVTLMQDSTGHPLR